MTRFDAAVVALGAGSIVAALLRFVLGGVAVVGRAGLGLAAVAGLLLVQNIAGTQWLNGSRSAMALLSGLASVSPHGRKGATMATTDPVTAGTGGSRRAILLGTLGFAAVAVAALTWAKMVALRGEASDCRRQPHGWHVDREW